MSYPSRFSLGCYVSCLYIQMKPGNEPVKVKENRPNGVKLVSF